MELGFSGKEWHSIDIMTKELVPVIPACAVWGSHLQYKAVWFQCDSSAVVAALQKGSAKEKHVMHLLRSLCFFMAFYDINLQSAHISGVSSFRADQLSRNDMLTFFTSNPQANWLPTPLPHPFLVMVGATKPDWISQAFRRLFHTIMNHTSGS